MPGGRTFLILLVLCLVATGCRSGRDGAAPFAARDMSFRDDLEVWQADERNLPSARTVNGLEIRVESVTPVAGTEWQQGAGREDHLPIAFRVILMNRSDHTFSVAPSQTFLLDDQRQILRLAGFRSVDGITSYFTTAVNPGTRHVWEVGFRPHESRRGTLPREVTLVIRMQGPEGRISEPFVFTESRPE